MEVAVRAGVAMADAGCVGVAVAELPGLVVVEGALWAAMEGVPVPNTALGWPDRPDPAAARAIFNCREQAERNRRDRTTRSRQRG